MPDRLGPAPSDAVCSRPHAVPPPGSPHVLREYALLADGERGALIGPRGDLTWMCAPRWHDDAVFSHLIGGTGSFVVAPKDSWYVWGGSYDPGTLIWNARWVLPGGPVECREALAWTGDRARAVVLRRIRAVSGDAVMRVRLDARASFGSSAMSGLHHEQGYWSGFSGALHLRLAGVDDAFIDPEDGSLQAVLTVPAGTYHDLMLEVGSDLPATPPAVDDLWHRTDSAWADQPSTSALAASRDAGHAYAVLRGLTSRDGGMVAAATTSLPERAGTGRNYDYRYAWIRDQCYAGLAVASHGPHPLLDSAVSFVAERILADGPHLHPAYTVDGHLVPGERTITGLRGYPGATDKVGNHAAAQFQLDSFGEALQLFAAADRLGCLDANGRRAAHVAADAIRQRWREPDAGVWELRDTQWTHSLLSAVAGLRGATAILPEEDWTGLAQTIFDETRRLGMHPSGRWQRADDDPRVDASLLLAPIRGALPPDAEVSVATLRAVKNDLMQDGYIYRFRQDNSERLADEEGAFLLCGFLASLASLQQGDVVGAVRFFERNRAACGPPALFAEEYDVTQRQLRGNLPQAFVHALLLQCATALAPEANAPSATGISESLEGLG